MKTLLYILGLGCLLTSCTTTKTHTWEGKVVSKKEYYRKISDFNDEFIRKYKPIHK